MLNSMHTTNDKNANPVVLLVEPNERDRELYGAWLEDAGITPINCPGPKVPGFRCLGTCGRRCPLAEVADLAVLDTRQLPGLSKRGLRAWRLLRYYLGRGHPGLLSAPWKHRSVSFAWPNTWRVGASTASRYSLRYARQMGSPSRVPKRFTKGISKPATFISRAAPSAATTIVGIPGLPVCLPQP